MSASLGLLSCGYIYDRVLVSKSSQSGPPVLFSVGLSDGLAATASQSVLITLLGTGAEEYSVELDQCPMSSRVSMSSGGIPIQLSGLNGTNRICAQTHNAVGSSLCRCIEIVHDNLAPNAVIGLTLGATPSDLLSTPTISFPVPSDNGPSGLRSIVARIVDSTGNVVQSWTAVRSGQALAGASLSSFKRYQIQIKTTDHAGNESPIASSEFWKPKSEDCRGVLLTSAPFANSGTADGLSLGSAYWICTAEQLSAISDSPSHVGKIFKLKADIDLSDVTSYNMIGSIANPFTGQLLGEGHTIKNLVLQFPSMDGVGLISSGSGSIVIKNLSLLDVDVAGDANVGGVIGDYYGDGSFEDIRVTGTVDGVFSVGGVCGSCDDQSAGIQMVRMDFQGALNPLQRCTNYAGGIVGYSDDVSLSESTSSGEVQCLNRVGGLAGYLYQSDILRSSSAMRVTATGATGSGGGVAGVHDGSGSSTRECYATGDVIANYAGGLIGWADSEILDSYATGNVTATGVNAVGGGLVGGIDQNIYRSYAIGVVTSAGRAAGLCADMSSGFSIRESFALGSVLGADSLSRVYAVGQYLIASYSNLLSTCSNSLGACTLSGSVQIDTGADPQYFRSKTSTPLSSWDFTTVWIESQNELPRLRNAP